MIINIKTHCVDEARRALNLFTSDEIEDYIRKVTTRAREIESEGGVAALKRATQEVNEEQKSILLSHSANTALDISKYEVNFKKMEEGTSIQSFLEKSKNNRGENVETAQNAAQNQLYNKSFNGLTKEHNDILATAKHDYDIAAAYDGVKTENSYIKELGGALKNYVEIRNSMLIQSGSLLPHEIQNDRFLQNMFNQSSVSNLGKENFVVRLKQLIDVEKTFKNTEAVDINGNIIDSKVDELIGNTFDNIIQGHGVLFTNPSVAKDFRRIEQKSHMFYHYKDMRSWMTGNQEMGQRNLMQAWMMDINSSSNKVGMARIMGSNPQMMYNKLREASIKIRQKTTKGPLSVLDSTKYYKSDNLFKQLLGANKAVWSPTLANIGSASRAISSTAKLGDLVLKSLSDISQVSGVAQRFGFGFWAPYFDSIIHSFNLIPDESRHEIARMMAGNLNTHLGYVSRYSDATNMGDVFNKMSNTFFHYNGVTAWDGGNKLSAMVPLVEGFGRNSNKALNQLNEQTQSQMKKFNINEHEWDALRSKTKNNLFTLDNVDRITDIEIRELWNKTDKIQPLSEYKNALYNKVFGMFDAASEFAVLNPTAYSKMITTANTSPGTWHGEFIRNIMQFKAYPIQYMRRVWVGGMQDFDSYQAKMMYGLNMASGTFMLAALSDILVSLGKGLTPPDPTKMSPSEQAKYFAKLLGSGFGIFNRIVDHKSQNSGIVGNFINTPSTKIIADPFIAAIALTTGNVKGAIRNVKEFVSVANPIGTIPFASPYMDALIGKKPYVEPGQTPLY